MIKGEVERIRTAMADLCEPLHDAFSWAEQKRQRRLPELDSRIYRWHGTHTVRAFAHRHLSRANLGVWALSGNHARNGELWLTDSEYRIRVLHGLNDDDVPPPGHNQQRRAFYHNLPLPQHFQEPLQGPANDQLLALWRIDPRTAAPFFRVVRPIGTWSFGAQAKTDLDFLLPATGAELHELHFEPQDEGLELQLPREENGDVNDAGGISS